MYRDFFGLQQNPFGVNPDPRYLYLTPQTQKALDQLICGIQTRQGLTLLTGEVGTGKTTVINRVRAWLAQEQMPTAFVFNSHLEIAHLFDCILADFGVPPAPHSNGSAFLRLNQWLLSRYEAGEVPVLIVDEAQGLSMDALEEIRMLLNCETPGQNLLQIVLAGQPELEAKLNRPELRQLRQRITFRGKTAALTLQETHDYIRFRLRTAGAQGKHLFSSPSVQAIHFYACGIPRVINLLCEHALINAYVDGGRLISAEMVDEIAHELQFDDKERPSWMDLRMAEACDPCAEGSTDSVSSDETTAVHAREKTVVSVYSSISPVKIAAPDNGSEMPCAVPCRSERAPASVPISIPDVTSSPLARAWTIFDGSNSGNGIGQISVASGERLLAELAAAEPVTVKAPRIAASGARPAVVSRARWNSRVLRPIIGRLTFLRQDAALGLSQLWTSWRMRWPAERHISPQEQDSAATTSASMAFLRRFRLAPGTWRGLFASSMPCTHRAAGTLLRWLREPLRPTLARASSRR